MMRQQSSTNKDEDDKRRQLLKVDMKDGYPIIYSCEDALDPSTVSSLSLVEVKFDYEVTISKEHQYKVEENLRELEWSILWNVAQNIGLNTRCELEVQQILRTRRKLQSKLVASLDSEPLDTIDPVNNYCVSTSFDPKRESCIPINGVMKALHTGKDASAVEQYLQDRIQDAMVSPTIFVKDVSQVVYQGNRTLVMENLPPPTPAPSESLDVTTLSVAASASVGVVAILVIALLVGRYVRRSTEKELDTMETAPTEERDIECPPTQESKPRRVLISVQQANQQPRPAMPVQQQHVTNPIKSVPKQQQIQPMLPPLVPVSPVEQVPPSVVVPRRVKEPVPSIKRPPPEPPLGAFPILLPVAASAVAPTKSVSLPSKRKRRKKKKKRRRHSLQPLKPLNEMETIPETSEEEREDDDAEYESSECGSDYSSDDGSLSRSSSTDSLTMLDTLPMDSLENLLMSPPSSASAELFIDSPEEKENSPKKSSIPRLPPPWV